MHKIKFLPLLCLILAVSGCANQITNSTNYSRSDLGRVSTVMRGKILDIREVNINGTNSGVGAGAGLVAGATAGSAIGGGDRSNIIGAVGGAVVGGVAGAMAEEGITSGKAFEFLIEQENGQTVAVVQSNDQNLRVGEKVMIVRSDKARVIRDNTSKKGSH